MTRVSSLHIVLLGTGMAAAFICANPGRHFSDHAQSHAAAHTIVERSPITSTNTTAVDATVADTAARTPAIDDNTAAPSTVSTKKVRHWVMQLSDDDPDTRAAAINALASAPKSQAFPVLQKVLGNGEDRDRELALDALHTLALREGDDDDDIRTALRLVIYDGDDEIMMSSAQIALDDIEHDLCLGK